MHTININTIPKSQQKDLVKAYHKVKNPTVKDLRFLLMIGPVGMVFFTIATVAFLFGLGVLFVPLIFLAPFALLVVPLKIHSENKVWDNVLPKEKESEQVILV